MIEKPIPANGRATAAGTRPSDTHSQGARPSNKVGPDEAVRRRRLLFRCWHRGTREADLLLGSFASRYVDGFDSTALDQLDALLEHSDPDIYDWITDRASPPSDLDTDMLALLRNHKDSFATQ